MTFEGVKWLSVDCVLRDKVTIMWCVCVVQSLVRMTTSFPVYWWSSSPWRCLDLLALTTLLTKQHSKVPTDTFNVVSMKWRIAVSCRSTGILRTQLRFCDSYWLCKTALGLGFSPCRTSLHGLARRQDYAQPLLPTGFVFQNRCHSFWWCWCIAASVALHPAGYLVSMTSVHVSDCALLHLSSMLHAHCVLGVLQQQPHHRSGPATRPCLLWELSPSHSILV